MHIFCASVLRRKEHTPCQSLATLANAATFDPGKSIVLTSHTVDPPVIFFDSPDETHTIGMRHRIQRPLS